MLCLVREEPTYGLVLVGRLDRDGSLGQIWSVSKATVYLALQRLEQFGLIRTAGQQGSQKGGPARSLLEATPAGRAAAQGWLSMPVEHVRDVRSELMIKLALLDRTGSDSQALIEAQLARLLPVAAALDDQLRATTGFEYTLVLWRHKAMTASLQFLRDLAEDLPRGGVQYRLCGEQGEGRRPSRAGGGAGSADGGTATTRAANLLGIESAGQAKLARK